MSYVSIEAHPQGTNQHRRETFSLIKRLIQLGETKRNDHERFGLTRLLIADGVDVDKAIDEVQATFDQKRNHS
jgi:hypothetical protein